MTEPEPHEETWLFAGSRVGHSGKRVHAWLPLSDDHPDQVDDLDNVVDDVLDRVLYFDPTGHPAVGSEYTVKVTRRPDGPTTLRGKPVYAGRHDNDELRARAEARHRVAETTLRRNQMERSDKRASALDAALEPLVAIAAQMRATDRDAFLAYVIRKIVRPW